MPPAPFLFAIHSSERHLFTFPPTNPQSSVGMVRPPKVRPGIFDLLQEIDSSDDDVSRRGRCVATF